MPTLQAAAALSQISALACRPIGGKTRADAALTSELVLFAQTAFIPNQDGELDPSSNSIKALGVSRWNQYTKWSDFTDFRGQLQQIKWTSPQIDVGEIKYFTIETDSEFDGTASYEIYTSSTGLFRGEESKYLVLSGDNDIAAFYGRYVYVTAIITGPELRRFTVTTSSETKMLRLRDIDSSSLSGSISSRAISLPEPVSRVLNVVVTPKTVTPYSVDLYVSSSATSELVIPMIISKADADPYIITDYITEDYFVSGATPSFVLYGIDNQPRNATVDITMECLPRQVMANGNIVTID
jgi:hypothetical protein